ncbi:hypothetical protein DID88_000928 [Monilinia fructigena]|uniref:Uncharacterized protein n=1 Tax=Monilinia fructigena TaxID=38457 RepID=A0A395IYM6_9HELO|nr:hypothetical protein DID88_000928 [Monilinia fructigena]
MERRCTQLGISTTFEESQIQVIDNKSWSTAGSLAHREPILKQFWENFKYECWGLGMQWNGMDCGDE